MSLLLSFTWVRSVVHDEIGFGRPVARRPNVPANSFPMARERIGCTRNRVASPGCESVVESPGRAGAIAFTAV